MHRSPHSCARLTRRAIAVRVFVRVDDFDRILYRAYLARSGARASRARRGAPDSSTGIASRTTRTTVDSRGRARGAATRMASRFREGTIKRACYDALRAAGEQGLTVRARGDDGGIPARTGAGVRLYTHTDRDIDAPRRTRD